MREVHSFEPFPKAFGWAEENIALNPELAKKIHTYCIGLSDVTQDKTVHFSDDDSTIGAQVRGGGGDRAIPICLSSASETLRPIYEHAKESGLDLIVKIDCEGSEFAIFEDLIKAKLLDVPLAYLIEWHKWWSADLTDRYIIEPLLAHGYVVLNQTHMTNPHAGPIHAVKYQS